MLYGGGWGFGSGALVGRLLAGEGYWGGLYLVMDVPSW
jgi:hypothetical protein